MDNTARFTGLAPSVLHHPSYVKSILPNPSGLPYIITGSDDEDIRVWDSTTLEESNSTPLSLVPGHCGEVSSLATWIKEDGGKKEVIVVSAGLDATLRRWSLDGECPFYLPRLMLTIVDLLKPVQLSYKPAKPADSMMTEEEERELAELMSDDD